MTKRFAAPGRAYYRLFRKIKHAPEAFQLHRLSIVCRSRPCFQSRISSALYKIRHPLCALWLILYMYFCSLEGFRWSPREISFRMMYWLRKGSVGMQSVGLFAFQRTTECLWIQSQTSELSLKHPHCPLQRQSSPLTAAGTEKLSFLQTTSLSSPFNPDNWRLVIALNRSIVLLTCS